MASDTPHKEHPRLKNLGQNRLAYHKPFCRCNACKNKPRPVEADDTQLRTEETDLESAGDGGVSVESEAPPVLEFELTGGASGTPALVPMPEPVAVPEKGPLHSEPLVYTNLRGRRAKIAQWIVMKHQGMKNAEIAEHLGITVNTLNTYISKAVKEGWLILDRPDERLEHEIGTKVVENIVHFLNAKDRQMTIEAAKGLGMFKSHQAIKVDGDSQQTNLQLNIQINAPDGQAQAQAPNIVGKPKLPDIIIDE